MRESIFGGRSRLWAARCLLVVCGFSAPLGAIAQGALAQKKSTGGEIRGQGGMPMVADALQPEKALPDAPGASSATASAASPPLPEAPPRQHDIEPGQSAPMLTAQQKVAMGFRGTFSLFAASGWMFASGYEQLVNGAPNWGTDRGAYGQRLGDAALRGISEDLLRGAVMMPLLHEDPRYYRLGSGHRTALRVLYAATRPLITRSDDGRTLPNFALIAGNLAGSALTNAYYPAANRGVKQTFITFGTGLGGAAVGNGIAEFLGPFFHRRLHVLR